MATERRAEVEWIGGLMDGEGRSSRRRVARSPSSRSPWDARIDEDRAAKTSPEELLAAAHAPCFAMAAPHGLVGAAGTPT